MMYRFTLHGIVVISSMLAFGCQTASLARKHTSLRHRLQDIYIDQAMDNLVSAHSHMPFVHMEFTDFLVQGTDSINGGGEVSQSKAAILTKVWSANLGGKREEQVSFHSSPITDQNEIYEQFLNFAFDPQCFVASRCPPSGPVHLMRECNGMYYWVPCEAGAAFQYLVLSTSVMRGEESIQLAYERRIVRAKESGEVPTDEKTLQSEREIDAEIEFDAEVPDGPATLVVILDDGRRIKLPLLQADSTKPEGLPVKVFLARWNPLKKGVTVDNLRGARARVYSHYYPPEAAAPDPLPKRILGELDRIRANQSLSN